MSHWLGLVSSLAAIVLTLPLCSEKIDFGGVVFGREGQVRPAILQWNLISTPTALEKPKPEGGRGENPMAFCFRKGIAHST